ncbi:MAG: hypothetical protein JO257_29980 [Deltaproteobacteria bacterium]|nr:hypothetical protein [Deltaproteobacteria bacterium]
MRILIWATLLVVGACGKKQDQQAPPAAKGSAHPAGAPLVAGPVPVSLPPLEPAQRRTLTSASNGFLTIDAQGVVRWGLEPKAGYAGEVLQRDDSPFAQLFPYPDDRGHEHHAFRSDGTVEAEVDVVGELTDDASTEVIVVADAAAPARITLRRALAGLQKHAVTLAGGAANTAVKYRFGVKPTQGETSDIVVHVGHLEPMPAQRPAHALLEIGDDTTTGDLVKALGVVGAAGVPEVRIHRVMGWGGVGPGSGEEVGPMSSDDVVHAEGFADTTHLDDATVNGGLSAAGVSSSLRAWRPRFKYCYEARGMAKLHGTVKLAFDVGADGAISNAKATGLDAKVDSCVAQSVLDLDITPTAISSAGHVAVEIEYTPVGGVDPDPDEKARARKDGYWCYVDNEVSGCERNEELCNEVRDVYTKLMTQRGMPAKPTDCKRQKTAWTSDGNSFNPTRDLCGKSCREVH